MRILFLSQLLPYPADAGAKVRSYYVLRWLAQRHKITLLAFGRPDDTEQGLRHLEGFCERVLTVPIHRSPQRNVSALAASILRAESFIINRDSIQAMQDAVYRVMKECTFDAVHSDQLWMAQYALMARDQYPDIRCVLDEHNACFQIFERLADGERNPLKRWLWQREAKYLEQYERDTCRECDHVVTVTDLDRRTLEGIAGGSNWHTIPICVDTGDVKAINNGEGLQNVLTLGTMFWPPNIEGVLWFVDQVWPKVVAKLDKASLTIVGKNPPNEVCQLEDKYRNVRVTGYAADIRPYVEGAGVFIVPLQSGGGMRVKIVDAWRWGLPIVSTRIGAEGISYQDGENILIADQPEAFAQAIVDVISDPSLSKRLRVQGRQWVEERYEWTKVYKAWDEIYGCNESSNIS